MSEVCTALHRTRSELHRSPPGGIFEHTRTCTHTCRTRTHEQVSTNIGRKHTAVANVHLCKPAVCRGCRVPFGFKPTVVVEHFLILLRATSSSTLRLEGSSRIRISGLTPQFLPHMPAAEAGREGLIDSDGAVRTTKTGYIQYRLVKALKDTVVPKVNKKAPTWTEAERERSLFYGADLRGKIITSSPMTPVEGLQRIHALLVVCQKYYSRNGKQTQHTRESA
jgi:hypothetical protein